MLSSIGVPIKMMLSRSSREYMSYARSPRPVCSMTMGTSIICGSFTFTFHTPTRSTWASGGIENGPPKRTDDTESRGSSRCGFYFRFYPVLHHVSNVLGSPPPSVLIDLQAPRSRDRSLGRPPRFSLRPQSFQAAGKLSLPVLPGPAARLEVGQSPFS